MFFMVLSSMSLRYDWLANSFCWRKCLHVLLYCVCLFSSRFTFGIKTESLIKLKSGKKEQYWWNQVSVSIYCEFRLRKRTNTLRKPDPTKLHSTQANPVQFSSVIYSLDSVIFVYIQTNCKEFVIIAEKWACKIER